MLGRVESDQAHSAEETNRSLRQAGKIWERLSLLHTADEGQVHFSSSPIPSFDEFILVVYISNVLFTSTYYYFHL